MGQLALGFRSLLIKAAIFFVMAALLAWALGGTLWPTLFPRAEVVNLDAVSFDGRQWYWRLAVGGRGEREPVWTLLVRDGQGGSAVVDSRTWVEVAGPVASDEALYYAGRASFNPAEPWRIGRIGREQAAEEPRYLVMPDRLAVEQQLARIEAGLDMQPVEVIRRQRPGVLDPPEPQLGRAD